MYKRLNSVYSGPFCDIYKAKSPSGSIVALKVVDLDFLKKPHDFRNEIKLTKSLSHRNIVEFIDAYTFREDHYLVMPFYEANLMEVMKSYMKKKTRFDLADPSNTIVTFKNDLPLSISNEIVWGLVDATEYLHQHHIIHRDIKPSNVFFKDLNDLQTPILGDFGISYNMQDPPPDEPFADKITDIATGYYKAPELCFAISDYGTEVDLWSLGILVSLLYSNNCEPANRMTDEQELEQTPELNDFALLKGTFDAFGTPEITDTESDLYFPQLADPECIFTKFNYIPRERKAADVLLPRCDNGDIRQLFDDLTRYNRRKITRPDISKEIM